MTMMPSGARTNTELSAPPASSTHTVVPGSSLRRPAKAHPAEPPPTIT
jgi:hypothetical protein